MSSQTDKDFLNYSVNSGLPSNEIYNVTSDRNGALWFSTELGVSRYDGYSFSNLSTRNGLPDNCIFELVPDEKDRLWIRSFNGKTGFIQNGKVVSLPCNDKIEDWLQQGFIRKVYSHHDTIFISANGAKSAFLKIYTVKGSYRTEEVPHSNVTHGLHIDGNQILNYHSYSKGKRETEFQLDVISKGSSILKIPVCDYNLSLGGNSIALKLSDGSFLFSIDHCIYHFDETSLISSTKYDKRIISLSEVDGNIYVGLFQGGALKLNGNDLASFSDTLLSGKSVTSIIKDHEENFWITSLEDGAFMKTKRTAYPLWPESGGKQKVNSVWADEKTIYAGLDNGALMIIKDDEVSCVIPSKFKANVTYSVMRDGDFILAGSAFDIRSFDEKGKEISSMPITGRGFSKSKDNTLWIASYGQLMKAVPQRLDKPLRVYRFKERLTCVKEDLCGNVWVGTQKGLRLFKRGKLHPVKIKELERRKITSICESEDGIIAVGTAGEGVYLIYNGEVTQINMSSGIKSDMVRSLCFDGSKLYVGTNIGVAEIIFINNLKNERNILHFTVRDGLQSNDIHSLALYNNSILVATKSGLSLIDPGAKSQNTVAPRIHISDVRANNTSITSFHAPELSPQEDEIEFHFTGISFSDPANIIYKYKLTGVDDEWNFTKNRNVRYPKIKDGKYKFEVFAINSDNTHSLRSATFAFSILAPFYKEAWFIYSMVILVPSLLASLFYLRINNLKKKEKEKAAFEHRIIESRLQALRCQMNPHFIFNSINAIQYFVIRNDKESAQTYLSKFASLVRRVLENSDIDSVTLERELETLQLYLDIEHVRHKKEFKLFINCCSTVDLGQTRIPPMLLQPFIENAVKHGLSHVENPELIIEIKHGDGEDTLHVIIEDNGPGMKKNGGYSDQGHTSMGIKVTRERLEYLKLALNQYDYKVKIHEASSSTHGTCVELYIPIFKTQPA